MRKRVLFCDDELDILRPTEFALKRDGAEVECARDGQEAWEKIQNAPPDVLVTDWKMPRLDGVQLIRQIRQDPSLEHLPVIMITARFDELMACKWVADLDLAAIVAKPFSPRELNHRIEQVLEVTSGARPTVEP